jgi:hypothetical protein
MEENVIIVTCILHHSYQQASAKLSSPLLCSECMSLLYGLSQSNYIECFLWQWRRPRIIPRAKSSQWIEEEPSDADQCCDVEVWNYLSASKSVVYDCIHNSLFYWLTLWRPLTFVWRQPLCLASVIQWQHIRVGPSCRRHCMYHCHVQNAVWYCILNHSLSSCKMFVIRNSQNSRFSAVMACSREGTHLRACFIKAACASL